MANVCDNELYASCDTPEVLALLEEKIEEVLYDGDIYDSGQEYLMATFGSKWSFPEEIMREITDSLPKDDTLFIRVMSIEYGCRYHAMWFFEDGEWHCE